jgi:MATE family multidrug resistance protein
MAAMVVLAILTRDIIPLAFLGNTAADHSETAALAATLLVVGASFFVFDGVQTVANGALRGFNDTRVPLLIAVVSFWIVGFPASYLLGFTAGGGAVGVWIGLSVSVAVYAALLLWRFRALIRRGYLPDLPGTPHH